MLIKWIDCDVPSDMRGAFSAAQEAWVSLAGTHGFLLQAGGWDGVKSDRAVVAALWSSFESHEDFMARTHDIITRRSKQATTYKTCKTVCFEALFEVPGTGVPFLECLSEGAVLRAADCRLRPGRGEHFEEVQREVWAPAMKRAGMLAGLFCKDPEHSEGGRYLVLSVWRTASEHDAYRMEQVPALRRAAGVDDDVAHLDGFVVGLEPKWFVSGAR